MSRYSFRLNGKPVSVNTWDPGEPLLYILRGRLSLRSPKFGCGVGQCGACTVLVDAEAVRSCTVPVSSVDGRRVTTLEGLGTSPVPAAFTAEQAAQCGYCTAGMIVTSIALLKRTPRPTEQQVKDALAGNLCRCGTHTRILRAVMRSARA